MAADPARMTKLSPVPDASNPKTGNGAPDQPWTNPVFTRLSGKRKNQAGKLVGFIVVAVIIAAIGLIGLYFATGPHEARPAAPAPASRAA